MILRRGSVIAAGLLICSALFVSPAAATINNYYAPCVGGGYRTEWLEKSYASPIDYVTGDVERVEDVHACTTATSGGASLVMTANIIGGGGAIVQIGYGRKSPTDLRHWVYTYNDNNGGYLIANTSIPDPIVGHHYRNRIWKFHGDTWYFEVYDYGTGGVWQWTIAATIQPTYDTWWGFESVDLASQWGGPGAFIRLTKLGYQYTGSQTTYYTSDAGRHQTGLFDRTYQHTDSRYYSPCSCAQIWAWTDNEL